LRFLGVGLLILQGHLGKRSLCELLQNRQIIRDDTPYDLVVNAVIAMCEDVAEIADRSPWDCGVGLPHFIGELPGRISQFFEVALDCIHMQL
jgi:hypothetical protein